MSGVDSVRRLFAGETLLKNSRAPGVVASGAYTVTACENAAAAAAVSMRTSLVIGPSLSLPARWLRGAPMQVLLDSLRAAERPATRRPTP